MEECQAGDRYFLEGGDREGDTKRSPRRVILGGEGGRVKVGQSVSQEEGRTINIMGGRRRTC
jgi:hypothetical protein